MRQIVQAFLFSLIIVPLRAETGNALNAARMSEVCTDMVFLDGCTDVTACNYDDAATVDDGSCVYPDFGYDCLGASICTGCTPEFLTDLSSYHVACVGDFPNAPNSDAVAINPCTGDSLNVASVQVDLTHAYVSNAGYTANGAGPDGALRIFGLTALGYANSDYFSESYPFILNRFENGVAMISGHVTNNNDSSLGWVVRMVFQDAQNAELWLEANSSNSLMASYGCEIDTANTEVYALKADQSYLTGTGGYAGAYLTLSHMPVNLNKRFQLGTGGNTFNCNYGFGGWFAWQGQIWGNNVMGMSGDLILDLSADGNSTLTCGEEQVAHVYDALNTSCGTATRLIEVVSREDTIAPTWANTTCPFLADSTYMLCADPESGQVTIPDACEGVFEDNCGGVLDLTFIETGWPTVTDGSEWFTILRDYSASDCTGNIGSWMYSLSFEGAVCPVPPLLGSYPTVEQERFVVTDPPAENRMWANVPGVQTRLFPNPGRQMSQLVFFPAALGQYHIQVRNTAGKHVIPLQTIRAEALTALSLELRCGNLPSGIYSIEISGPTETLSLRWMVVH